LLVVLAATATLAIGMEESRQNSWGSGIVQLFSEVYEGVTGTIETWPSRRVTAQVRQSDPRVYVDGELSAPLKYGPLVGPWGEAAMIVRIPGEGRFYITPQRVADDWIEVGLIHDNVIEFQAGRKSVRIVCNKQIVDTDRPVFVHQRH
jgi:hypothetical protein